MDRGKAAGYTSIGIVTCLIFYFIAAIIWTLVHR